MHNKNLANYTYHENREKNSWNFVYIYIVQISIRFDEFFEFFETFTYPKIEKNQWKFVYTWAMQCRQRLHSFWRFFFQEKIPKVFWNSFMYIDYYFAHLLKFQMQYRPYGLSKSFLLEVTNGFYKDALHVAAIAILYKIPPLLRRTDDDFHSLLYVHLQS